jgi:hypothetical protein
MLRADWGIGGVSGSCAYHHAASKHPLCNACRGRLHSCADLWPRRP